MRPYIASTHRRDITGREFCDALTCKCHDFRASHIVDRGAGWRERVPAPPSQAQVDALVAADIKTIVVIVPLANLGGLDDVTAYRLVNNELRTHAQAIYVQRDRGLYLACKCDPDPETVGWPLMSEERQRAELLQLRARTAATPSPADRGDAMTFVFNEHKNRWEMWGLNPRQLLFIMESASDDDIAFWRRQSARH